MKIDMHVPNPLSSKEKHEIVIFVTPLMGYLTPTIEMVNLMLAGNKQIHITILIAKLVITDSKSISKIESFMRKATTCECDRVRFHILPLQDDMYMYQKQNHSDLEIISMKGKEFQKGLVREIVSKIQDLSGFIVDAGNTTMIDVANEFGVPSYVFFASGAAFLGLLSHFQALQDSHNQELSDLLKGRIEFLCPSFYNPIPISLLPLSISWLVKFVYGCRKAKGILVNTFAELETNAFDSFLLSSHLYDGNLKMPPVYPVGPVLNRIHTAAFPEEDSDILDWLNDKMSCSVVFLCFGSKGSLNSDQVKEIAYGLEASGHSFLWSLRQPSGKEGGFPSDYGDYGGVLPKGFLDRTMKTGKVIGWVPQLAVLSHCGVGGFVSHCGWNSILESIWCGVPMATWPLQGDQQMNAFQVVKELGVGVEITMDYDEKRENQELIKAEKIEKGIRKLMDYKNEGRRRVKELSRKSKEAMEEGGSSYLSLQSLLQSMTMTTSCNDKPFSNLDF